MDHPRDDREGLDRFPSDESPRDPEPDPLSETEAEPRPEAEAEIPPAAPEPGLSPGPDCDWEPDPPAEMEGALEAGPQDESGPLRRELQRRFDQWLTSVLEAEDAPAGLDADLLAELDSGDGGPVPDPDDATDRYAVWSSLTALTQEVKLQGRAFRQLDETLGPVAQVGEVAQASIAQAGQAMRDAVLRVGETVRSAMAAYGDTVAQARRLAEQAYGDRAARELELRQDTERRVRREMLLAMTEVHDRLRRGLELARRHAQAPEPPRGFLARFQRSEDGGPREALRALEEGYRLGMDDLEERLEKWGVREMPGRGAAFDPERMNVVDVQETDTVAEGTVVDVYRAGYEWQGDVLRLAQVKVARRPRPSGLERTSGSQQ